MDGTDQRWMAEALREARKGLYSTPPNPAVGCVVVSDGVRLASGWHEITGGAHAEVNAINAADIPAGSEFYVTLEPCSHHGRTPPCVDALIRARPSRVVVAMQDPNPEVSGRGLAKLRDDGIAVTCGVLENEARQINRGFVKRMEQGRPFVSLKMASSLDGRTALKNGISQWITSEPARKDVQFLRARASAILSSASTVKADNPTLNLRLTREDLGQTLEPRQPVRIIVDSKLRLEGNEKIFSGSGEIWVCTTSNDSVRQQALVDRGAKILSIEPNDDGSVNLEAMMFQLGALGINEIHTECGKSLAGALIDNSLVDQLQLYMAPHLLGNDARGLFDLAELDSMDQRTEVSIRDVRKVGEDLRLTLDLN